MAIQNKDIGGELLGLSAITSASWDGSADLEGAALDTCPDDSGQVFRSAKFVCETSGGAAGDEVAFKIQHSADDDEDAYTDVLNATGEPYSVTISGADGVGVINFSNALFKRHIRLVADSGGSTVGTSVTVQAAAVLGGAGVVPVEE